MKNRIIILDELRGIAILMMIAYHTLYSMEFLFGYSNIQLLQNPFLKGFQISIGVLFITISGISSYLSDHNFTNGIKVGLVAIAITIATTFVIYSERILFGVLHFLATMMIFSGFYKQFKPKWKIKVKFYTYFVIACTLLFIACYNIPKGYIGFLNYRLLLPKNLYKNFFTSILGFPSSNFFSADYYPIIPWVFLFVLGFCLGPILKRNLNFQNSKIIGKYSFLTVLGKRSLIIYLVHQPIIIALLFVIQWVTHYFGG